jgi:hypothetical protein
MYALRRISHRCLTVAGAVSAVLLLASPASARAANSVLSPSVTSWDFGNNDFHDGLGSSQTFTFTNNTDGAVNVNTAGVVGPDATAFQASPGGCAGTTLLPTGTCSIQVQFTPNSPGAKTASLELIDDSGTLDVQLSGTGITGTLTANPNPLVFQAQPWFNGGQQQGINIQNSNDAGTQATSAIITGPDASRFYVAYGGNCSSQQYGPGSSCGMGIGFNPPQGPGTFHAQLEVSSDSLSSPLIVPLDAVALSGPHAVIDPLQTDFGNVAIGKSTAQAATISNDGDFPLQVQEAFMITGVPSVLAITDDGCSGQVVNPGSSCQLTVSFAPNASGYRDGAIVVIGSGAGSVTPIAFSGTGIPPLNGTATVTGTPAAGSGLSCHPVGNSDVMTYAYRWLRDGQTVTGAMTQYLQLSDADVGARFSCRIVTTNAVSNQTVTSPQTAPVTPMSLTREPGAFTDEGTCRSLQTTRLLELGSHPASIRYGMPATPWAPLTLASAVALRVSVDGQALGSGRTVNISPQTLSQFADGSHTLLVTGSGNSRQSRLLLGPCGLAVRLDGGPRRTSILSESSQYGTSSLTFGLPRRLHLTTSAGRKLGWATVKSAGYPSRGFNLIGARTTSNDVTVTLTKHTVTVTNLPSRTGLVTITLGPGVLAGRTGRVTLAARERGSRTMRQASTPATWLP